MANDINELQEAIEVISAPPALFERDTRITGGDDTDAESRRTVNITPSDGTMHLNINDALYIVPSSETLDLNTSANWDTTTPTDYSTAANRAGVDFYIYACEPASGSAPDIVLSANSTVPSGYTASASRKIGGGHCLCVAVGTIASHDLTGYLQGDILPASVWDLKHRRRDLQPEGMVYSEKAHLWVDIYLMSGTGASTVSEYGATISDTRNWMDFVDDAAAVGKPLLLDAEFQIVAAGSNEETNIAGSADPVTTGGHSDTASRRMISNIGCEDCCGGLWQWLDEGGAFYRGTTGYWGNLPGGKGSIYTVFTADPGSTEVDGSDTGMDVKLLAGGSWDNGSACGSRARTANNFRWNAISNTGGRAGVEPL